ncbi:hypothetical protein [Nonomuraea dietziae]|uniref:hypothetical protein n=1 Tax=Nonomuraea dietziae TaxID=65515 RepID=UPI0031D7DEEA
MISAGDWLAIGHRPEGGHGRGGALGLYRPGPPWQERPQAQPHPRPQHHRTGLPRRRRLRHDLRLRRHQHPAGRRGAVAFAYDIATDSLKWRTKPVAGRPGARLDHLRRRRQAVGPVPRRPLRARPRHRRDPALGQAPDLPVGHRHPGLARHQHRARLDGRLYGQGGRAKAYRIDRATMALNPHRPPDLDACSRGPTGTCTCRASRTSTPTGVC